MSALTVHELTQKLLQIPQWKSGKNKIYRTFTLPEFADCIAFVDAVARRAIAVNHHPDIDIRYNKATIRLSTHDEGGVTDNDIRLAADIDGLGAGHDNKP